ncbi:MAG: hypothetical protein RIS05_782 [Actinomycetota bacterium]|jgi:hypothetical protein
MKIIRRILAAVAVIALAFKGIASFLSWAERQDNQAAEAWVDEDEVDDADIKESK